ncbi:hypothetical protein GCHA_1473 [Paraglaciecola chathamensis S18K6]|uniref:Uncharacterized protein n=2 Tax=Paraglaciecola chathamensis TaxID=368405 RepID=A0ABQ0IC81_9ALTE|nr:hypothetical protein GAGA_4194 [Paraglaciecola agarilytica NO2]GAC09432.1 hypothetical protein GCHA_1473 [Paraglaciecola chathamensis S18K6]
MFGVFRLAGVYVHDGISVIGKYVIYSQPVKFVYVIYQLHCI